MRPRTEAPTLAGASVRAGGVAVVRLVLGGAFVAGALLLALTALGRSGRPPAAGFGEALPVPPDAGFDPGWVGILLACVPSTIGVPAVAVPALVVSPALAAVLGGVLIALGAPAGMFWMQLAARERREEASYRLERGPRPRLFVVPR
ncbi:MAG: hypothetical protein ACM3QU_09140 [Verrucomicrobiota bacterium]